MLIGRDGCRVPLPWTSEGPAFGFYETGEAWLPQPAEWAGLARDAQRDDPGSTLTLYKNLLAERRARGLGAGTLEWVDGLGTDVVAFRNGSITVVANLGDTPGELPSGPVVVSSGPLTDRMLPVDQAVWLTGE